MGSACHANSALRHPLEVLPPTLLLGVACPSSGALFSELLRSVRLSLRTREALGYPSVTSVCRPLGQSRLARCSWPHGVSGSFLPPLRRPPAEAPFSSTTSAPGLGLLLGSFRFFRCPFFFGEPLRFGLSWAPLFSLPLRYSSPPPASPAVALSRAGALCTVSQAWTCTRRTTLLASVFLGPAPRPPPSPPASSGTAPSGVHKTSMAQMPRKSAARRRGKDAQHDSGPHSLMVHLKGTMRLCSRSLWHHQNILVGKHPVAVPPRVFRQRPAKCSAGCPAMCSRI